MKSHNFSNLWEKFILFEEDNDSYDEDAAKRCDQKNNYDSVKFVYIPAENGDDPYSSPEPEDYILCIAVVKLLSSVAASDASGIFSAQLTHFRSEEKSGLQSLVVVSLEE